MQRKYEELGQLLHGKVVRDADRAHGVERTVEQLDAFVLEHAERDQLVVLHAAEGANDFSG